MYMYLCFWLGKLLGLVHNTGKTGIDFLVNQFVLIALEVVLQFPHTALCEVDLRETVGQIPPLLLCPIGHSENCPEMCGRAK